MDLLDIKRGFEGFSAEDLQDMLGLNLPDLTLNDLAWIASLQKSGITFKAEMTPVLLPLEMDAKTAAEGFDECQREFARNDMYDLILIENASEIAKEQYLQPNLEKIMGAIAKEYTGVEFIPSETFNIKYSQNDTPYFANKSHITTFASKHKNIINSGKIVMSVLALNLGDSGGHYGGFIMDEKRVLNVYDSMSTESGVYTSEYMSLFRELGELIFKPVQTHENACINPKTYLQPTGGFPENLDPTRNQELVYSFNTNLNRMVDTPDWTLENIYELHSQYEQLSQLLRIQIPESQDHFCFIWSLWMVLSKLSGIDMNVVADKGLVPLLVIKRFIWTLIQHLKLARGGNAHMKKIFMQYFPIVWIQPGGILSSEFEPYRIKMPSRPLKTIAECMKYSVQEPELHRVEKTATPQKVLDKVANVTGKCKLRRNMPGIPPKLITRYVELFPEEVQQSDHPLNYHLIRGRLIGRDVLNKYGIHF